MYHFPPLFAVVSTLSGRPDLWGKSLDTRQFYWSLALDGETLSRVVHHWLAAIAVAAMIGLLLARRGEADAAAADQNPSAGLNRQWLAGSRWLRR